MAKVILHKLAKPDSPIYDQPLMVGGFSKPLFSNIKNLSRMDQTFALIESKTKLIKKGKKKCQSDN